ncbi:uapA, partial [Symbiodinium sp. CCMP2456]
YWGGGVFCAENDMSRAAAFGAPQVCTGNGDVALPYGDVHYFGLGLSVMIFLVFIQAVGSPFMKNCSVALDGTSLPYVNGDKIEQAGVFTFLWTTTFNIGFYPPAFIPLLLGFVITAVETVGDIQASCDVSGLPIEGPDADSRIQGGLLADAVNSFLACLMTCPPNTTFSQNNGVIAITRCASRAAGIACCFWLILLGCFEKFGAAIASIPDAVLGGMTTFLFANVLVSGINIVGGSGQMGRRTRFILAVSLGVGVGVAALPNWAEGGGLAGFHGGNLKHNIGLWPAKDVCKVFPTEEYESQA